MVKVAGKQSLGRRDNQEDAFRLVFQDEQDPGSDILMILADGMGGHAGGEIAATLSCKVFASHFVGHATATRPRPRLEQSLQAANSALAEKISHEPALKGMGCTLIGALKIDDRLSWVSVGDSILFLLRKGKLSRLNADHSYYGELRELVQAGKMTEADAKAHPKRNALRAAGMGQPIALVELERVDLEPEDVVIIATDGLETLNDTEITEILTKEARPDVRALSSDLLNAVEAKGKPSQDNTTIIVYRHTRDERTSASNRSQWSSFTEPLEAPPAKLPLGVIGAAVAGVLVLSLAVWFLLRQEPPVPETTATPEPAQPGEPQSIGGLTDAESPPSASRDDTSDSIIEEDGPVDPPTSIEEDGTELIEGQDQDDAPTQDTTEDPERPDATGQEDPIDPLHTCLHLLDFDRDLVGFFPRLDAAGHLGTPAIERRPRPLFPDRPS